MIVLDKKLKVDIFWAQEVLKLYLQWKKVLEILGHQNTHFSMRNLNIWFKFVMLYF